jgi:uncharacterized protein YjbJ (UPF0337 family)
VGVWCGECAGSVCAGVGVQECEIMQECVGEVQECVGEVQECVGEVQECVG